MSDEQDKRDENGADGMGRKYRDMVIAKANERHAEDVAKLESMRDLRNALDQFRGLRTRRGFRLDFVTLDDGGIAIVDFRRIAIGTPMVSGLGTLVVHFESPGYYSLKVRYGDQGSDQRLSGYDWCSSLDSMMERITDELSKVIDLGRYLKDNGL